MSVTLTADLVESFAATFLSPLYDNPQPTPELHREVWGMYCTPAELAAIAAPREHAKSTAFTHVYGLANVLFRAQSFILVVSATEELAVAHLADIAKELRDNDDIRTHFGLRRFVSDTQADIIVECDDGHQFRILAKGSGQKMRGLKWRGTRPGLILGDDLEEDEQVDSLDRRKKFRKWFYRALIPAKRRGGLVRIHGTILHEDSLLARLMKSESWFTKRYSAHASFGDFSSILWPEQFPEARLRAIQKMFIDDGDAAGYAQEYLNDPRDNSSSYLQPDWFVPMEELDYASPKVIAAAADFAISKQDHANRTSLTVGGKDVGNILHFLGQRIGRWDSYDIVEEVFALHSQWHPDIFWVESGAIWSALEPIFRKEMQVRGKWINFVTRTPVKDKASRGRALQRRMRGHGCRFDSTAEWFEGYKDELLHFTGNSDAKLDDQFDSSALLALGFEELGEVQSEDFFTEEDEEMAFMQRNRKAGLSRDVVTGY